MNDWIIPDWPAPYNVKALFTSRNGGVSSGINGTYASLNLGAHVNDRNKCRVEIINFGYSAGDDMDDLLTEYEADG